MRSDWLRQMPSVLHLPVITGLCFVLVEIATVLALMKYSSGLPGGGGEGMGFLAGYMFFLYMPLMLLVPRPTLLMIPIYLVWAAIQGAAASSLSSLIGYPAASRMIPEAPVEKTRDAAAWIIGTLLITIAMLIYLNGMQHADLPGFMGMLVGPRFAVALIAAPFLKNWMLNEARSN